MKKTILNFLSTVIFSTVILSFFSCKYISNGDPTYTTKPTVQVLSGTESGIAITFSRRSADTDFIYLYRLEKGSSDPAENIGIINQKGFPQKNTFIFQDQFVTADTTYKYKAVFHDSKTDIYNETDWSDEIKALSGNGPLTYDTSANFPTSLKWKSYPDYTLTFDTDISKIKFEAPNSTFTEYTPTLVLNNGEDTKYFPIPDGVTTMFNLRELVSDDFIEVPITIVGLIGQHIEYLKDSNDVDTETIKIIHYSSMVELESILEMPEGCDDIVISYTQGIGIYAPGIKHP